MTERLHFHFSFSCTGEGNGNPLQCSCLENPRDGGAWWDAVYGVAQSWTRLKRLSSSSSSGGWKSKIKVPAWVMSMEASLFDLWMATFRLRPLMAFCLCMCIPGGTLFFCKDTRCIRSRTFGPHLILITPINVQISKYSVTGGRVSYE